MVASATTSGAAEDVVLAVLALKTGYDAEMIEDDMELESELGIDSIKRVEILSEVQARLKVEAKNVDALSRTRTVGEVVAAMRAELCGGAGAERAVRPVKPKVWQMTREQQREGVDGVVFDYEELLEFAEGGIAGVFGPDYAVIDQYRRRVRLPMSEYLLVSRVTKMDAKTNEYVAGASMTTEYDLPVNGELSEGGDVPWAILVESGQCDLLLISYLGIDFQCKGERVYRLLDTTLTFYGVAHEGDTLVYDIKINGYAKGKAPGEIKMFFFEYDCFVNGELLIEMRNGVAGFFTDEELAAGKGIVHSAAELKRRARTERRELAPFAIAPCEHKTRLSERDMEALCERRWAEVLGAELDYKPVRVPALVRADGTSPYIQL